MDGESRLCLVLGHGSHDPDSPRGRARRAVPRRLDRPGGSGRRHRLHPIAAVSYFAEKTGSKALKWIAELSVVVFGIYCISYLTAWETWLLTRLVRGNCWSA